MYGRSVQRSNANGERQRRGIAAAWDMRVSLIRIVMRIMHRNIPYSVEPGPDASHTGRPQTII